MRVLIDLKLKCLDLLRLLRTALALTSLAENKIVSAPTAGVDVEKFGGKWRQR